MPVVNDAGLLAFQNWTLRVRPASSQSPRLLLLIHGWTGDENSMWIFVRNFPSDLWIVAPRAPHADPKGGFSWRAPGNGPRGRPSLEDLRPSAEALLSLVDAYAASVGVDAAQFDVVGFSQGAALANTLTLLHPERIRRVGALAGFVPDGAEDLLARKPLEGKPFFVAHGTLDETVDIEYARQSIAILEQAGASVTFCEAEVGHKLSAECLRALEAFFR